MSARLKKGMERVNDFLAFASILAMDTPVLILDEPTTGQDYLGVQRIGSIVDKLYNLGKTISPETFKSHASSILHKPGHPRRAPLRLPVSLCTFPSVS